MKSVLIEMEKLKNPNSGLGQFCLHLGKEITELNKDLNLNFYVPENKSGVFGNSVSYILNKQKHKFFRVNTDKIDIWHSTHQGSKYLPSNKRTRIILTIHDLNFIEKHSGWKRKIKLKQVQEKVDRAEHIVVVSNYTKRIVEENLKINNKQISVIYNGSSLDVNGKEKKPDFAPKEKFLFTLGIINPKKNFHVLLPLIKELKNYSLVIAGDNTHVYAKDILETAKKLELKNKIILPGKISESEKLWLYKNCEAFLFPSLAEGFGLPVIEAMSLGKPVFLSKLSSLPEIGGQEACYFDSFNTLEMKSVFEKGMGQYFSDKNKSERIKGWVKQFSWENAAQEYLKIYTKIY